MPKLPRDIDTLISRKKELVEQITELNAELEAIRVVLKVYGVQQD